MALRQLEDNLGRRLGDRHDPLLVSVRSGAAFSMPGMMETVLNIGLNDASVKGLAESPATTGSPGTLPAAAADVRQNGAGIPGEVFSMRLDKGEVRQGRDQRRRPRRRGSGRAWSPPSGRGARTFRPGVPAAPARATRHGDQRRLRLLEHRPGPAVPPPRAHPQHLGTAVNVCTMVFGNLGDTSGTGVAFTRDPASGAPAPTATIRQRPGRGRRRRHPQHALARRSRRWTRPRTSS